MLFRGRAVRGYDTGPGNMLMDAWSWRQCAQPYDNDASWANAGQVILPLLQQLLRVPSFAWSAPPSPVSESFQSGRFERRLTAVPLPTPPA
ncbi:anhydro-N-acetylmuramic acid kinase, partial [Salmonella enterica]|uniref:anhydro-N-acetylmuramic acid kinase n=1 Tax=Salmonella enterica TaxID=28901 RepID=UPI00398C5CD5